MDSETRLHLLGFAVILQNANSGILLKRHDRIPRTLKQPHVIRGISHPQQLPPATIPLTESEIGKAIHLLTQLTKELSRYEDFVRSAVSSDFARMRRSTAPRKLNHLFLGDLADAWRLVCVDGNTAL